MDSSPAREIHPHYLRQKRRRLRDQRRIGISSGSFLISFSSGEREPLSTNISIEGTTTPIAGAGRVSY